MYKDRIRKWKLDKKHKEGDMLAILRKQTERNAVGKGSSFRVRGQPVTIDEVLHYLKRKKNVRDEEAYNAPTPSDVSCRTPSPAPILVPLENDNHVITTANSAWPQEDEAAFCEAAAVRHQEHKERKERMSTEQKSLRKRERTQHSSFLIHQVYPERAIVKLISGNLIQIIVLLKIGLASSIALLTKQYLGN